MHPLPALPDSLTPERQALIEDVVARLLTVRGLTAIVLGGSHAAGGATRDSDIDLGLYYADVSPFSIDEIRKVAHGLLPGAHPVVTDFDEWGPWVNGGAWLALDDGKVDLLYRNIDRVEHTIDEAVRGVWHHDFDQQPTFGFRSVIYLAEIACCLALHDPYGRIAALKHQVGLYPAALKHTIISDSLWSAEFTLTHTRAFARAADIYNTTGCLTRIASNLTQALFALNETYFLNDKHAPAGIDRFTTLPPGYRGRVEAVLGCPGRTAQELSASVEAMAALWQDVAALAGAAYKPRFELV